jgi:hypothetical protein
MWGYTPPIWGQTPHIRGVYTHMGLYPDIGGYTPIRGYTHHMGVYPDIGVYFPKWGETPGGVEWDGVVVGGSQAKSKTDRSTPRAWEGRG